MHRLTPFESEPVARFGLLDFPPLTRISLHELSRVWRVRGTHVRTVPIELVADSGTESDTAKQDDLSQISGNVEIRVGRGSALHHGEPFLLHSEICIAFGQAWNRLRNGDAGRVFCAARIFLFVAHHDLEAGAIVVPGEELALLTDDKAPAVRQFAAFGENFPGQIGMR